MAVESKFEKLTADPLHPTDVLGGLLLAESFERRTRDDLIVLQDRPWAILSMLTRRALTISSKAPYTGRLVKHATLATDAAALSQMEFDIPSGSVCLVRESDPKGHEFPTLDFGPEIPLRVREKYWINATRLPFGQIPNALSDTKEIEAWFVNDDPSGSFLAMFREHGLSIAPIFANFQRQFYKVWAPQAIRTISSMKPERVRDLIELLRRNDDAAQRRQLEGDKKGELPFMEVPAASVLGTVARLAHPTVLSDLLLGTGIVPPLPLLVPNPPTYGYPPLLARHYRLLAGGYQIGPSGRQHIQDAGDEFERLVSRLMATQGATTTADGIELVSVMRAKKNAPDEVDVLAIMGKNMLILECKAEMDPPGAWTQSGVANRVAELKGYIAKLNAKRERWSQHLAEGKPVRRERAIVRLPVETREATLHAGIVSMRIEPRFSSGIPLLTLWPQAAAAFAKMHFPSANIFPVIGHRDLAMHLSQAFRL